MNPVDKKKMENFVKEISNCMVRMDAERDLIRDILNRCKDELGIKPKILRRIARIYYRNSLNEERDETEELFETYDEIFNSAEVASVVDKSA